MIGFAINIISLIMHLSKGDLFLISLLVLHKVDKKAALTQSVDNPMKWEEFSLNYTNNDVKDLHNKTINKRMILQATDGKADSNSPVTDPAVESSSTTTPTTTPSTTTTPTTTPTTPAAPLPSQLLGATYFDNKQQGLLVAEKGMKVSITCRCQKGKTVGLTDGNRKTLQFHECSDDLTHEFELKVEMENFGEYWCHLNEQNSIFSYIMDYYVCEEHTDVCREDAHCKEDDMFCIVTKEHPKGQSCQTLRNDQCSFKYNTLYCPQEFVTMCEKNARTRVLSEFVNLTAVIPAADSYLLKYDSKVFNFTCPPGNELMQRKNSQTKDSIFFDSRLLFRQDASYRLEIHCPSDGEAFLQNRYVTKTEILALNNFTCKPNAGVSSRLTDEATGKLSLIASLSTATRIQRVITGLYILRISVRVQEYAPVKAVERINCHVTGLSPLFTTTYSWKYNDEELSLTSQNIDSKLRGSGTYKCGVKMSVPVCDPHFKYVAYFYSDELKIDVSEAQSTTTVITTRFTGDPNQMETFETMPAPTVKPMEAKLFNLPFATGLAIIISTIASVVLALLCFSVYLMRGKGSKTVVANRFLMFRKRGAAGHGRNPYLPERFAKGRGSPPSSGNRSVGASVGGDSQRPGTSIGRSPNLSRR